MPLGARLGVWPQIYECIVRVHCSLPSFRYNAVRVLNFLLIRKLKWVSHVLTYPVKIQVLVLRAASMLNGVSVTLLACILDRQRDGAPRSFFRLKAEISNRTQARRIRTFGSRSTSLFGTLGWLLLLQQQHHGDCRAVSASGSRAPPGEEVSRSRAAGMITMRGPLLSSRRARDLPSSDRSDPLACFGLTAATTLIFQTRHYSAR